MQLFKPRHASPEHMRAMHAIRYNGTMSALAERPNPAPGQSRFCFIPTLLGRGPYRLYNGTRKGSKIVCYTSSLRRAKAWKSEADKRGWMIQNLPAE